MPRLGPPMTPAEASTFTSSAIELTREYTKRKVAAAVPGSVLEGRRWILPLPTPRSAMVALKLFPHLAAKYPDLVDLRAQLAVDVRPVDYAAQLDLRVNAPRVEAAMNARGWSLSAPKVTPTNSDELYQVRDLGYGAACLRKHGGFYLGWDRGLGKTLGSAAIIDDLDSQASLVIAPNTAKQNTWASELEWACPWLEVLVLPSGNPTQRQRTLERAQGLFKQMVPFVMIVHYEALALIAGKKTQNADGTKRKTPTILDGWKKLGIHWDLMVADEGHRFANPDAQQTKAAGKVPRSATMICSGSVFQNEWEELFGPLHLMFPKTYAHKNVHWCGRFLDYVDNGYTRVCVGVHEHMVDGMRDELGRFLVLREKQNHAIHERDVVQLSPEQRRVYDELADRLLADLPNGERIKSEVGIALLGKLRQVAAGLDAFDPDSLRDSAKLDRAMARIHKSLARGNEIVVFVWHKSIASALEQRMIDDARWGPPWVITGDVPQKERDRRIEAFQEGERRVLIGTIATMGESVNLQRANHVIRIEKAFNPALNQQAVDRCDRQGQQREVYCTDIVADRTVDLSVIEPTLANKEALRAIVLGSA